MLLGRILAKRPEKSLLLTGLRGVGKTVLLNEIDRMALAAGYRTILLEAHEGKSLAVLLAPQLRRLLFDLDMAINAATPDLPDGHEAPVALTGVYHNLLRQWAEVA